MREGLLCYQNGKTKDKAVLSAGQSSEERQCAHRKCKLPPVTGEILRVWRRKRPGCSRCVFISVTDYHLRVVKSKLEQLLDDGVVSEEREANMDKLGLPLFEQRFVRMTML